MDIHNKSMQQDAVIFLVSGCVPGVPSFTRLPFAERNTAREVFVIDLSEKATIVAL
jgi:hypothetical protein